MRVALAKQRKDDDIVAACGKSMAEDFGDTVRLVLSVCQGIDIVSRVKRCFWDVGFSRELEGGISFCCSYITDVMEKHGK